MLNVPEFFKNNVFRYEQHSLKISLQNTKYKKVMDVWMQGRKCPSTGAESV